MMKRMTWEMVRPVYESHKSNLERSVAGFIDEVPEEAVANDDYQHRRLDRAFGRSEQESVDDIVQRLKERHGRMASSRYDAEGDAVPQRLLMPGVNDPSLWTVRVKVSHKAEVFKSD